MSSESEIIDVEEEERRWKERNRPVPKAKPEWLTRRWYPLRHHPQQQSAFRDMFAKQFICLPCGRRSGKTELCKRAGVIRSFEPKSYPDARYGFGAPTFAQAKRIWWRDIKDLVPLDFIEAKSESELMIRLKTGTELWVVGMDKPERIEGVGWDGFVCDEAGKQKEGAIEENIMPALADRGGWLWVIGVPEGRNHYYRLWNRVKHDPLWGSYTWKSKTVLPPELVDMLSAQMDERTARQEFDATWESVEGSIYYAFSSDRYPEGNIMEFEPPDGIGSEVMPWRFGMDFNVYPLCAVLGWEDEFTTVDMEGHRQVESCIFIHQEFVLHNADTDQMAKAIKDELGPRNHILAYPDPTGNRRTTQSHRTDHAILRSHNFQVETRFNPPAQRDRHNSVNSMCRTRDGRRRLFIHPRCTKLIEALEGQSYPEGKSKEAENDPLGHINAALGYWIEHDHSVGDLFDKVEGGKF